MKSLICGVLVSLATLAGQTAHAGCVEDTEVTSAVVHVSPEVECLVLDVTGTECVGGAILVISNACPETFEVDSNCSGCVLRAESGGDLELQIPLNDGEVTTHQVLGRLGAQTVTIDLEYEGQVTDTYEGCSATGLALPGLLPLVTLMFGFRRSRS
ncbi:MAG: hypothetical protein R3E66_00705 [bacterium]